MRSNKKEVSLSSPELREILRPRPERNRQALLLLLLSSSLLLLLLLLLSGLCDIWAISCYLVFRNHEILPQASLELWTCILELPICCCMGFISVTQFRRFIKTDSLVALMCCHCPVPTLCLLFVCVHVSLLLLFIIIINIFISSSNISIIIIFYLLLLFNLFLTYFSLFGQT